MLIFSLGGVTIVISVSVISDSDSLLHHRTVSSSGIQTQHNC